LRKIALLLFSALAACGSAPDPDVARGGDVELATRALNRGFGASTLLITMGVIDPTQTPETIAAALYQRVLSETNSCAMATRNGAALDVDLGAGCTLASTNVIYGGTLHTEVSKSGSTVLVSSTLSLTVDGGQPLTGLFSFQTSDGNTFTFGADLMLGGIEVTAPDLRGSSSDFGAQLDATGTLVGATGSYMLTATGVHQRFTGCYPDDGQVEITAAPLDEFWSFASDTPQDGKASVGLSTTDNAPKTIVLPARPACPPAARM
jgi:hypothetical protein